ncbi:MAG TPA: phosphotransferase [Phycisphaerae bacterium]|nr:phosphotransferase [Phycisphaerae bacterium]
MVLNGFRQLSAEFFADLLSRRHQRTVRVRGATVTDRPAGDLKQVDLETSIGPVRLLAKSLGQRRKREALVWRFLVAAGHMPIPEVYHVEFDEKLGRYGVILDLPAAEAPGSPWDRPRRRAVGSALARLHAPFWGKADELPETFAPPKTPPEATVEPAARRFLDHMPARQQGLLHTAVPEVFAFLVKLLRMPPAFFAEPDAPPKTLVHGALRREAVLFGSRAGHPEPVLVDWEHARAGRCTEDLAALTNSLSADERAAGREDLLSAYVDALALAGVAAQPELLHDETDRQRVLLAGRELPRLCKLYAKRDHAGDDPSWCESFVAAARADAAELKGLLDRFRLEEPPIPEETERSWQSR